MKEYLKVFAVFSLSAFSAWILYLLLLLSGIVHVYEFSESEFANLPADLVLAILFFIFIFLYSAVFKYSVRKAVPLQIGYLLLSGVLMLFKNEALSAVCIFNPIMLFLWDYALMKGTVIKITVFICSVAFPVLLSSAGCYFAERIGKNKKRHS